MTNSHIDDRPWYERAHSGMARVRAEMGEKLAALVLETCGPYLAKPVSQLDVLDCGCGYGQTAIALASRCRYVLGIEPCQSMYDQAVALAQQAQRPNLEFENCSIHRFTKTGCFDLAILDNVLEHISDQHDALARLYQALRTNGLLFVVVPNKLWPVEVHYGLPFLSYLPLPLANLYLRATGRGKDYSDACFAPTYWGIRRLLRKAGFHDHWFIVPPNLSNTMKGAVWYYRLGATLLRAAPWLWCISKAFVIVARKHK